MTHVMIWIAALVAIACGLLIYESDLLWKVQQLNLFLYTPLFFKQQMVVAAGMLSYIGRWFTQFFYYPWLGVLLLCGWWILLLFLLKKTFAVPAKWASLLLIPVALLLVTIVDTGYWVYMLKLVGHFFISTIGTTLVVALLWAFRSMPDKYWLRAVLMVVTCVVGYPLIGIYGLAATLLMGIWSWRLLPKSQSIAYSLIALISVIAVPLICYRYVYYQTNLANIYYVGLPLYYLTEEHHQYYIPYYLLALFMVVMVCLPLSPSKETSTNKSPLIKGRKESKTTDKSKSPTQKTKKQGTAKASKIKSLIQEWAPQVIVLAILTWGVIHFWYKDDNFHHELKMQHFIEHGDWQSVLKEGTVQDEPTRAIVMMRNLALWRLGRQGDEMYQYKNGSKAINAPFDMRMMLVTGPLIYYHYGQLNYCNRLCTEMGVEFNWRVEHYQYLTRCALLCGDKKVARKYINILKKTLFFDDWAEWAENLIDHPDLIAKERELEPITHMLNYPNALTGDQGNVESFLMKQLARSSYAADSVFLDQSMYASLWVKDPRLFWIHFAHYVNQHPKGPIPVVVQEAAYLFGKLENLPNIERMPFSQGVKDSFNRFMEGSANYENMDIEEARELMYPIFGNTFYYDYYLMSNLPEY